MKLVVFAIFRCRLHMSRWITAGYSTSAAAFCTARRIDSMSGFCRLLHLLRIQCRYMQHIFVRTERSFSLECLSFSVPEPGSRNWSPHRADRLVLFEWTLRGRLRIEDLANVQDTWTATTRHSLRSETAMACGRSRRLLRPADV
jgi:hypothetical protein